MKPILDAARVADTIDVLDPATGEVLGSIPVGSEPAADRAVLAAREAARVWSRRDPAERGAILKEAARRLRGHVDELARLQTRENGKPLAASREGVEGGIGSIERYAELGPVHRGYALQGGFGATDLMIREPRGVVAAIVPWNDPVALACGVISAALVTGNAVVFKPSEKTPLSGRRLFELLEIPDGALQLLLGDERAGRPLVAHAGVDVVAHTGSVETGREIANVCARRLGKKALLELGGKDPLIVDAGVDPEWAAEQAASGCFANAGQVCTSIERVYAHAELIEPFLAALTERARALRVGNGLDEGVEIGPLIDERQRAIVHRQVSEALDAGATLHTGGEPTPGAGFFYPPTVLSGVSPEMAIVREETFGPVAAVRAVASFDAALEEANASDYGLAATVLTTSDAHAERAWPELEAGTVKINSVWGSAPGGAADPRKESGAGLGYGPALLDELTLVKAMHREPARRAGGQDLRGG